MSSQHLAQTVLTWLDIPTDQDGGGFGDLEALARNALSTPPADDVREQLAQAIENVGSLTHLGRGDFIVVSRLRDTASELLAALSTPRADDVREAVAVKRWCSYFGCRVVVYEADDYYGQGCPVCGHVGEAGEVRPRGTVTDAEVEAAALCLGERFGHSGEHYVEDARAALEAAREVHP